MQDQQIGLSGAISDANRFLLAHCADYDLNGGLRSLIQFKSVGEWHATLADLAASEDLDALVLSAATATDTKLPNAIVRLNGASPSWNIRGADYGDQPQAELVHTSVAEAKGISEVAIWSAQLSTQATAMATMADSYKQFRGEAAENELIHVLEVFNPHPRIVKAAVGAFVNDWVVKTLSASPTVSQPKLVIVPFGGPNELRELCEYSKFRVGVSGGAATTTLDAFTLVQTAKDLGATACFFGRRIKMSVHPRLFVKYMRAVASGELEPRAATHEYRGDVVGLDLQLKRTSEQDLVVHTPGLKV